MSTIVANSLFSRCFIWSSQVRFSLIVKEFDFISFFNFLSIKGAGGLHQDFLEINFLVVSVRWE